MTKQVREVKEANGFKLHTTRKSKEGTYLHVLDTKAVTKRQQPEFPGDLQVPEVLFTIDEKAKIKVYVRNAYSIGLVEFAGQKEENYKKKDKDGNEQILVRKVNQYNTKPFTYLQGDDSNLYIVVGLGTKAKGTLTEGWADLSVYARSLVVPKVIIDITQPSKVTFAIDEEETAFYPVQVDGTGVKHRSDKPIMGYKLTFMGKAAFDEDEVTNLPVAVAKEKATISENEF